ncbi:RNA polymerase I subunit F [Megalopta genalis]|uniref:RNA polymerase I subunit F n=1 Tax=Megalopta genalis TaxID=115081 RepID=UPI003FD24977
MKFKTYTGITWSLLELTGLLEDEESRVYYEKSKKHFGLHPFHLTNLNASLNEILSSNLNSYDSELKGFLLAYQNPKLLTPLGEIFYDTCFIHIDVEAEFYIFRPEVGSSIKGIVNKKGVDHIGVLVHKAFNVSIPKPDDQENWLGDNLEIGQEVKFVVTFLDLNSKLPFIRGNLDPDNYLQGCRLFKKAVHRKKQQIDIGNLHSVKEKRQHTFFDSEISSDEDAVQVKEETPTQSRKKRSSSEQEEVIKYDKDNEDNEDDEDKRCIKKIKKSRSRKKSKDYSSQSSIDEYADVKTNNSPSRLSRRLSSVELEDEFKKIKSEISTNISNNQIKEEIISENESRSKKSSAKRKNLDETDNSASDFATDKDIKSSHKKSSKKRKVSHTNINESLTNIKVESFNNHFVNEIDDKVEESPSKKKHKKLKNVNNFKEEDCAETSYNIDEENGTSADKKKRKKHSKKGILDLSEVKVEPTFENVVIKIEESDDINTHNEIIGKQIDDVHIDQSKKRNFKDNELKVHKVKIKKEKSVPNTESDVDQQKLKVHKVKVKKEKSVKNLVSDEDHQELKVHKIKIKKEKSLLNILSDEDQQGINRDKVEIKEEKFVASTVTDEIQIDTYNQYDKQVKKYNKNSPNEQLSVSGGDVNKVKVKMEKSIND